MQMTDRVTEILTQQGKLTVQFNDVWGLPMVTLPDDGSQDRQLFSSFYFGVVKDFQNIPAVLEVAFMYPLLPNVNPDVNDLQNFNESFEEVSVYNAISKQMLVFSTFISLDFLPEERYSDFMIHAGNVIRQAIIVCKEKNIISAMTATQTINRV